MTLIVTNKTFLDEKESNIDYFEIIKNIDNNINENKTIEFFINNFSNKKDINKIITYAIINKKIDFIEKCYNKGLIQLEKIDQSGRNILHYLCSNDEFLGLIIEITSKKFECLVMEDKNGLNPILIAFKNKSIRTIEYITKTFQNRFKEEIEIKNELILEDLLKKYNLKEFELLNNLIKENTKLDLEDKLIHKNNRSSKYIKIALESKNYEFIHFLLKKRIGFYEKYEVCNLISIAIFDYKILNMILNHGYSSNNKNSYGDHPVIFLLKSNNIDIQNKKRIFDLLLKKQFNINIQDQEKNNLLHYCVLFKESLFIKEFLIKNKIIDNHNKDNINSVDLSNNADYILKCIKEYNLKYDNITPKINFKFSWNKKKED